MFLKSSNGLRITKTLRALKVKSILISQPKPATEKSPYFDLAKNLKLKVDFRSFIHVEGVSAIDFRKEKIDIKAYSAIILTSRSAVDHFFRMCQESIYETFPVCSAIVLMTPFLFPISLFLLVCVSYVPALQIQHKTQRCTF